MKLLFFAISLFVLSGINAQVKYDLDEIRLKIEKYIENQESEIDYTDLFDQLEYYMNNPINLNQNEFDKMYEFVLFSPQKIENLKLHIQQYGLLKNILELQEIEGFDYDFIQIILPFVTLKNDFSFDLFKQYKQKKKHEIVNLFQTKMPKSQGYSPNDSHSNKYQGNQFRHVLRYQFLYNQFWSLQITAEKDAGEIYSEKINFFSANLSLKQYKNINSLIIGDYQAAFGQGLTFGSGLSFGKSPNSINIFRSFKPIRAYRSLNENEFLRGIAANIKLSKLLLFTTFVSYKKIDGTISNDSNETSDNFESLINIGLYRNDKEILKRRNIKEFIIGANLSYQFKNLKFGYTIVRNQFDKSRILDSFNLYQIHLNTNKIWANQGVDFRWNFKNTLFFGEITNHISNNSLSCVVGLISSINQIDVSLLVRDYSLKATPIYSNAFGENFNNINEKGIYLGTTFNITSKLKLNAYADNYYFPWLKYLIDAPSHGSDYLLELLYTKRKHFQNYLRFRLEQKQRNLSELSNQNIVLNTERKTFRYHSTYKISANFQGASRVEWVIFKNTLNKTFNGFTIFQDFHYSPSAKTKFSTRFQYFNSEDFNSRIYAFENDVPFSFSVPMFQNTGIRSYILIKQKINNSFSLWFRYAITKYHNIEKIGTGLDEINSNKVHDIKIQLRCIF